MIVDYFLVIYYDKHGHFLVHVDDGFGGVVFDDFEGFGVCAVSSVEDPGVVVR